MKLSDWLEKQRMTKTAFAKKAEISKPMVTQLASGGRLPSFAVLTRITAITKGQVSFKDFQPAITPANEEPTDGRHTE